jgi:hypothetical protein
MNAAADSLMSIFGMTRAKCCYCIQSIATDQNDLYCTAKGQLVERDDQCESWERATGSDDE